MYTYTCIVYRSISREWRILLHIYYTYLKGGHEGLVSSEVGGEDEFLHVGCDLQSLPVWQVVQETSLSQHCLSGPAVMLLQDTGML